VPGRVTVLDLRLEVRDPEVIEDLLDQPEGPARQAFGLHALRIGVLALRAASGVVDAAAVREAGEKLVRDLRELLAERGAEMASRLGGALSQYLDPSSGALAQRLESLLRSGGELERVLKAHVEGDDSILARALARQVGENSPIFRMLSPTDATGLRAQLASTIEKALAEQRQLVLREFSLDQKDSALSRLVTEVRESQSAMREDLRGQVETVVGEFSLDKPDSALSRLVSRVEATQRSVSDQFSLDNDASALSRMSRLLDETSKQIDRNLTLDEEGSALSRLKRELVGTLEDLAKKNATFQTEVRETLARLDARRTAEARGTAHGGEFEDQLGALLTEDAVRAGDVCEATGATVGAIERCKVGDHVVELGPDSAEPGARIVVEAKEDQSYGLKDALAEIETARKNRKAQVGVFVFSRRTVPDGLPSFARHGRDVVAVWDSEDPSSDVFVRAALSVARALVVREAAERKDTTEAVAKIQSAVRALEKHMGRLEQIRTWAVTVRNNGDNIEKQASKLAGELAEHVKEIDEQVTALNQERTEPA
jgi:hypothetical protein